MAKIIKDVEFNYLGVNYPAYTEINVADDDVGDILSNGGWLIQETEEKPKQKQK